MSEDFSGFFIKSSQDTKANFDPQGVAEVFDGTGSDPQKSKEAEKILAKYKGAFLGIDTPAFERNFMELFKFLKDNKGKEVFITHQDSGYVMVVAIPKANIAKFKKEIEAL